MHSRRYIDGAMPLKAATLGKAMLRFKNRSQTPRNQQPCTGDVEEVGMRELLLGGHNDPTEHDANGSAGTVIVLHDRLFCGTNHELLPPAAEWTEEYGDRFT
jgi:hypothetical protein